MGEEIGLSYRCSHTHKYFLRHRHSYSSIHCQSLSDNIPCSMRTVRHIQVTRQKGHKETPQSRRRMGLSIVHGRIPLYTIQEDITMEQLPHMSTPDRRLLYSIP